MQEKLQGDRGEKRQHKGDHPFQDEEIGLDLRKAVFMGRQGFNRRDEPASRQQARRPSRPQEARAARRKSR